MADSVYKYRVWCNVTSQWRFVWLDENQLAPTVCPTDSSHDIDISKTSIVDEVVQEKIIVQEEDIPTGGHYQAQGISIDVTSSGLITKDISFPHPISLMAAEWTNKQSLSGDEVEFIVAPNTVVGFLTQNAPSGTYSLNVSSTVIENISVGYDLKLFNIPNIQESCGRVLAINTASGIIEIENAPQKTFLATSPTYVQMETHLYRRSFLAEVGRVQLGEAKIGGSYIPANTTIRANYYNNSGTNKSLIYIIEYLY